MKVIIQSLTFITLLLPVSAKANDTIVIESFEIKPSICIVARDNNCQQKIHFQWRLSQVGGSCLYRVGENKPLYCSKMEQNTSIVLAMSVEKSNEFVLRLSGQSNREARKQLTVRELGREVRQSRRHLWSVF